MPSSVSLLMAIHCHQPVGNFDFVFEEAFRQAYEPFLTVLARHPGIRLSLHYSGSLLDWLSEHQPAFLSRVRALAQRGQIELLASGYYEPILPLLPEEDRQGQLALMQATLRRRFGVAARGLWLTERVWEPELPETLARAGIRYTMLDTNQFRAARQVLPTRLQLEDEQGWELLGSYVSEYGGSCVTLFPASKRLRYSMPFQEVPRTIEFLKRLGRPEPVAVTFADDGEKFGLWPKTHAWVYDQGWLEQFFSAVESESAWLTTSTFSDYLDRVGPNGRVYLPCGSYEEMLEWSGGYFRNFFVKYPEANAMQQKMLDVSRRLQEAQRSATPTTTPLLKQARRELYLAQCNCAYWHGVFGGLYLSHLRRAVYRHLIAAESRLQRVRGAARPSRALRDLDGDGKAEVSLRNRVLHLVVDPEDNGSVTEIDDLRTSVNLVDTLARRREPYHERLKAKPFAPAAVSGQTPASIHDFLQAKEEGLDAYLVYDDHRRSCFVDHPLSSMPTLNDVWRSTWSEHRLWSAGSWDVEPMTSSRAVMAMRRPLERGYLRKTLSLAPHAPRLAFSYEIRDLAIPVVAIEMNLSLHDARWDEPSWHGAVRTVEIRDETLGLRVAMTMQRPATVVRFPIHTISESEEGLERTFQGVAVVCLWTTEQARRWSCGIEWEIGPLA